MHVDYLHVFSALYCEAYLVKGVCNIQNTLSKCNISATDCAKRSLNSEYLNFEGNLAFTWNPILESTLS